MEALLQTLMQIDFSFLGATIAVISLVVVTGLSGRLHY